MKTTLQPHMKRLTPDERAVLAQVTRRALDRAKEHGWRPTAGPWDHWFVPSAHEPGITRKVRVQVGPGQMLWFDCSCPSGFFRDTSPLSCWHAAAVGKHLVNTGWAWWTSEGCFRRRRPTDRLLDSQGNELKIVDYQPDPVT